MFRRLLPFVLLCLPLGGCVTWEKPGATDLDRQVDTSACNVEGYNRYPPFLQDYLAEPAHWEPTVETCSEDKKHKTRTCTTSGGYWVPDRYETRDLNDGPREAIFNACMFRKGWHQEQH
ncbi:hypothetical protein [Zavarzinia sp.]|uniref:hypothetical protein n=1 Tax=Zavarzinia sp. TaxID=2027920 RepID=UPI00356AFD5E